MAAKPGATGYRGATARSEFVGARSGLGIFVRADECASNSARRNVTDRPEESLAIEGQM